jgi:hypothetical protein
MLRPNSEIKQDIKKYFMTKNAYCFNIFGGDRESLKAKEEIDRLCQIPSYN